MTLYAALNEINEPCWNISTAEDPVEYTLPGLNQMQVKKQIGLTFAAALRCFLRQDPDIILVGEIRDTETAEIAVEAALTGHVLFSTLHTNDAPSTISRLTEMGIEPFMISTATVLICAQRLLRRLCKDCVEECDPDEEELDYMRRSKDGSPIVTIKRPKGCDKCNGTGHKGRTGTHEMLMMTDELREVINKERPIEELKEAARRSGMRTLFEDCMEKVKMGLTSLKESLGNVRPDEQYELAPIEGTPEWHADQKRKAEEKALKEKEEKEKKNQMPAGVVTVAPEKPAAAPAPKPQPSASQPQPPLAARPQPQAQPSAAAKPTAAEQFPGFTTSQFTAEMTNLVRQAAATGELQQPTGQWNQPTPQQAAQLQRPQPGHPQPAQHGAASAQYTPQGAPPAQFVPQAGPYPQPTPGQPPRHQPGGAQAWPQAQPGQPQRPPQQTPKPQGAPAQQPANSVEAAAQDFFNMNWMENKDG
jgi:hypothetical protein